MRIPYYGKIYNLGHRSIAGLLDEVVEVQEKVDGSCFSFANLGGELLMASRTVPINPSAPHKLFIPSWRSPSSINRWTVVTAGMKGISPRGSSSGARP